MNKGNVATKIRLILTKNCEGMLKLKMKKRKVYDVALL